MQPKTADQSEAQLESLDLSLKCGDSVVSFILMTYYIPFSLDDLRMKTVHYTSADSVLNII